jgi:hypothetical protein
MGNQINITSPANNAPSVTITNPANGTVFTAPANVTIQATASDSDGSVTNVQFRVGNDVLANAPSSPYSATTNGLPAGNYTFSAIASDNNGATATNAIDVICNARPSVVITNPPSGAKFAAPANIVIETDSTDSDGNVTNVQFFSGATPVGNATTAPFALNVNAVGAGSHNFMAVASDNYGATMTSAVVNVLILTNSLITSIAPLADGQFELTISGVAGQTYATEATTNFQNWSGFTTNIAPAYIFSVTDSVPSDVMRFYRTRLDLD